MITELNFIFFKIWLLQDRIIFKTTKRMTNYLLGLMFLILGGYFYVESINEKQETPAAEVKTSLTAAPTQEPPPTTKTVLKASTETTEPPEETPEDEPLTFPLSFTDAEAIEYIARFLQTAQDEQRMFKIPVSITLAQGLLESTAGASRLATLNNNHFGIKCFSRNCSGDHCTNFTDDTHKDFFRKFESPWFSYREHSLLLKKPHYAACFKEKNYKGWARQLRKCGYATDRKYDTKLIGIIEKFNLHRFDN